MTADGVLILGAHGLLGTHVVSVCRSRDMNVLDPPPSNERYARRADLVDRLDASDPACVVNCLGYAGPDVGLQYLVHVGLPRVLADWIVLRGRHAVHISTNAVFRADPTRRWMPDDRTDPATPYEIAKCFGEDPRLRVIRTTFVGRDPRSEGIFDSLRDGRPYWDRLWNGVTALVVGERIADLVEARAGPGLEHLHAPEPMTFADLATALGSRSKRSGWRDDGRLLGGGPAVPPFSEQLGAYLGYLETTRA